MSVAVKNPVTFLDHLQTSIEAALRSPEGVDPPTVILWTDPDSQWKPLIATLVKAIPHLYTLGEYNLDERTGPVIWLKCIVDRTLPDISPPAETVPILYLPGVGRQQLRAGSDCPEHLQPLVELQYRGAVWHQRNGRDWTVEAFLTSKHGLGLDVSLNNATRQAMVRALPVLATESVANLRGHRLEADDFDRLLVSDPLRDLLSWMSDPDGFRQRCDESRWETFCTVVAREYDFDPDKGPTEAGQALREGNGKWDAVWERFCEAPRIYRGISSLLREVGPPKNQLLFMAEDRDPKRNADQEVSLRAALEDAESLPHHEACKCVLELEKKHAARREWIWSELGESTWALALESLAHLATAAQKPLGGAALRDVIDSYVNDGWRCDRAALDALACVSAPADVALMAKVLRSLYEPWLDTSARHFQSLTGNNGQALKELVRGVKAEKETCLLFADGLRFDVAGQLQEVLEARGVRIRLEHRVAPTPTVTATAKPVASPAHPECGSTDAAEDFAPAIKATGQKTNAQRLRNLMKDADVAVLLPEDSQMPASAEKGGWSEVGQLDSLGHKLGARLVTQINTEVETIADRVMELLDAGWTRVKVVTDHGWLLMPGGLRKDDMPKYLTETKWSRCAVVKGESATDMPTYAWHWNPHVRVASPPGVGSFAVNTEYSHGGVSVQECVVPELVAERGAERASAKIKSISWRGMRCRIAVESNMAGLKIDLRLNWKQPATSIVAAVKDVEGDGETTMTRNQDDGQLALDEPLMEELRRTHGDPADKEIRRLPIVLLSDDIEDSMQAAYVYYRGKQCIARSDGTTLWQYYEGDRRLDEPIVSEWTDKEANMTLSNGSPVFKLYVVFSCSIASAKGRWGGVYKMRTTSKISASQLLGSLQNVSQLTGGCLAGVPLELVVRPYDVTPKGKSATAPVYVTHVELCGSSLNDIQQQAIAVARWRRENGIQMAQLRQGLVDMRTPPGLEAADEAADIQQEFHPDPDDMPDEQVPLEDRDPLAPNGQAPAAVPSSTTTTPAKTTPPRSRRKPTPQPDLQGDTNPAEPETATNEPITNQPKHKPLEEQVKPAKPLDDDTTTPNTENHEPQPDTQPKQGEQTPDHTDTVNAETQTKPAGNGPEALLIAYSQGNAPLEDAVTALVNAVTDGSIDERVYLQLRAAHLQGNDPVLQTLRELEDAESIVERRAALRSIHTMAQTGVITSELRQTLARRGAFILSQRS